MSGTAEYIFITLGCVVGIFTRLLFLDISTYTIYIGRQVPKLGGVVGGICPLIGIGLTYLPKLGKDQSPCPHVYWCACNLILTMGMGRGTTPTT